MIKTEKIKKYIKVNGLKFIDVARFIKVDNIYLNAILCDRRKMTKSVLEKLHSFIYYDFFKKKREDLTWHQEVEELIQEMDKELNK